MTEGPLTRLLNRQLAVRRRHFLQSGLLSAAAMTSAQASESPSRNDAERDQVLKDLESWLTKPDDFQDVSRGKPKPHSLSDAERQAVGLTRDTWTLNVISDPEHPARIRQPLQGNMAFTFADLMKLAKTRAVRFPKVMTCLNIGCPLGNGIWEGVPLRDVVWLTQPTEDLRRVFYYGYHNDDPAQMFRSSLPVGRILEDLHGLPPVILCYKLNGQWLTPERGGPVRVVVPEAYGFKSIKWLSNVVLSNIPAANDTYAEKNNDVDSPLKTFCATLSGPGNPKPNAPVAVSGWAQVGIAGLNKVQVWVCPLDQPWPDDDPYFTAADWQDAELLPAPEQFGGGLPDGRIPEGTMGFDAAGRPETWPLPLSRVHWYFQHPGLPEGKYSFRCRTIDANGIAQPMPRPFRKSGHAKIEHVRFEVG
ncbi:MAG: molybdopterin-dependent oxidoreductase [Fuerstiella sp.]